MVELKGTISPSMADGAPPILHLGGPDRPPRFLRDLLEQRIAAVPPGGEIVWATYYFRDAALAEALLAASERGVRIRLRIEGHPRLAHANRDVIARLRSHGLGGGLRVHAPALFLPAALHPHLHTKIYAFSHPRTAALVGSFNPSGNLPEDPAVIAEIGDQDRGHNLLVEFAEPALVARLSEHVRRLGGPLPRLSPRQNRRFDAGDNSLYFYPRLDTGIIERQLAAVPPSGRIRGAVSHLKHGRLAGRLAAAARAGARVELLVHDTQRRVPDAAVAALAAAGASIRRFTHAERLPMHAKFLLIERERDQVAYFGSFNFNPRSLYLNHELLVRSRDPGLFAALAARFEQIAAAADGLANSPISS